MFLHTRQRWVSIWVLSCLVLITVTADVVDPRKSGKYLDRPTCKNSIRSLQESPNFTKNTDLYFLKNPTTGLLYNGADNMTVTKLGCDEFCGGWSWYWDAIPRLMTWILPILLLLSNIELSPIDKKRFMTVAHALGDPIDSFWSLIHKIYIWNRLYAIGLRKSPERNMQSRDIKKKRPFLRVAVVDVVNFFVLKGHQILQVLGFEEVPPDPDPDYSELPTELSRHDRARIIAAVLAGFEEISGAKIESEDYYHMITRRLGRIGETDEDPSKFEEWRRTARILADARTNEFPRTCLAVAVYILGIVAAFVPEIGGGNTSPPGGRIACGIFLSWLVPLVLVSNTIGAFTSRRSCLTIMRQFVGRTTRPLDLEGGTPQRNHRRPSSNFENSEIGDVGNVSDAPKKLLRRVTTNVAPDYMLDNISISGTRGESLEVERSSKVNYAPASHWSGFQDSIDIALIPNPVDKINPKVIWKVNEIFPPAPLEDSDKTSLLGESSWNQYFESLQWLGSIYTYRPWKVLYLDIDHRTYAHRKNILMAVFAFLPILVSTVGAFVILWYAVPTGWNCRHIWVLGIFVMYVFSAIWTSRTYIKNKHEPDGHKLWVQILRKDGLIAVISTLLILFSTAGLFNNCWCWSDYMMRREHAYVPLETIKEYEANARAIYSIVVTVCICFQVFSFVGFMVWWRHGLKLVRWTESRRRQEWRHEMRGGLEHSDENFLLFWYEKSELVVEKEKTRKMSEGYMNNRRRT